MYSYVSGLYCTGLGIATLHHLSPVRLETTHEQLSWPSRDCLDHLSSFDQDNCPYPYCMHMHGLLEVVTSNQKLPNSNWQIIALLSTNCMLACGCTLFTMIATRRLCPIYHKPLDTLYSTPELFPPLCSSPRRTSWTCPSLPRSHWHLP